MTAFVDESTTSVADHPSSKFEDWWQFKTLKAVKL
jgi:hypothetical protein